MKQLICELCRSTNFSKEDNLYVCRDCGSKYSLEEARRLLVDVQPEPVDPPAPKAERIPVDHLALARQAKISGEDAEALRHYTIAQREDPENWEPAFFTVYYNAMLCKLSQIPAAAGSVRTVLGPVMEKIQVQLPQEARHGAYAEVALYANKAASFLYDKARAEFDSMSSYVRSSYSQEMVSRCGAALDILYNLGDHLMGIDSMQSIMLEAWKTGVQLHEKMLPFCGNAQSNRDIMNSYVQKVGQYDPSYLGIKAQSQREDRRKQIIEEMNSLRQQMNVPAPKGKAGMVLTGVVLLIVGIIFCAMGLEDDDMMIVFVCGVIELIIGAIFCIGGLSGGNDRQDHFRRKEQLQARYDALARELNSLR